MKLLFIQGGSRLYKDSSGKFFTDGNLNNNVFSRYKNYCDDLTILLRTDYKEYDDSYLKEKYNDILTNDYIHVCEVPDLMRPKKELLNLRKRIKAKKIIKEEVSKCDKAIIRSAHNFYTLTAIKYCKKYKKDYLIEVAGYAYEGYWSHGLLGKIVAPYYERKAKKAVRDAKYCLYVTEYTMQKRYPCKGNIVGCSDVEISNVSKETLNKRIKKYEHISKSDKIVIGTIGWLNYKLKGQQDVIKSIYELKNEGNNRFIYELVGHGDSSYLKKLVKKYGLQNEVIIKGSMNHDEIFKWLEHVDVYIQPSYSEGLCRAIIEAMSTSCPVIASNAGGNVELVNPNLCFKKGCIHQIKDILSILSSELLINESNRSFKMAGEYHTDLLNKKRDYFYYSFVNNKKVVEENE